MQRTVRWIDIKNTLPPLQKANVTAEPVGRFCAKPGGDYAPFVRPLSTQTVLIALRQPAQTPRATPLGYAGNCDFVLRLTVEPPYRAAHPVLQRSNLRSQSHGGL